MQNLNSAIKAALIIIAFAAIAGLVMHAFFTGLFYLLFQFI